MRHKITNLRGNDKVEVITGKDKGRVGKISRIDHESGRVYVERINLIKKHKKASEASQSGQILEIEAGLQISNVMLVCPECTETARVGRYILEDGNKVRICKKCNATIQTVK